MIQIESYRSLIWRQFKKNPIGLLALSIFLAFFFIGLYAPLLASGKPLAVIWRGKLYFPLFRYLFYKGYFTKPIDIFFNILMLTLPLGWLLWRSFRSWITITLVMSLHMGLFFFVWSGAFKDPASHQKLLTARESALARLKPYREDPLLAPITPFPGWAFELKYLTDYGKLGLLLRQLAMIEQDKRLTPYKPAFEERFQRPMPTLLAVARRHEHEKVLALQTEIEKLSEKYEEALKKWPEIIAQYMPYSHHYLMSKIGVEQILTPSDDLSSIGLLAKEALKAKEALEGCRQVIKKYRDDQAALHLIEERQNWYDEELKNLKVIIPPLIRPFHWEEDAGGAQGINQMVPWWELSRINRKDLVASLLFGIRVSIVVGAVCVLIALAIGLPLGTFSGYFAGKTDLVICRLIEIWEAMPTFFMLLLVIALTQSKSIFLVMGILGIFSWTSFGRFMRAEVFKQRSLSYVMACKSQGFSHFRIMFWHILPNAVPPILTLLPFAMMGAISSEAGLSFLGLGEEGATSWGVLMDEGRSAFPAESYLLWPPAILLTILLISIALMGDVIRDAIDPKLRK